MTRTATEARSPAGMLPDPSRPRRRERLGPRRRNLLAVLVAAALLAAVPRADAGPRAYGRKAPASTLLGMLPATAGPGGTVVVPVRLLDRRGTPLGPERGLDREIQGLALRVDCLPVDAVRDVRVRRAGLTARIEPRFEAAPRRPGSASLVASFGDALQPLAGDLASSRTGMVVAELVVTLAKGVPPGTRIELRLDPGVTMLSNQAGTVTETVTNGWLQLVDGSLLVR